MQVQTTTAAYYYELESIPINKCFRFVNRDSLEAPSPYLPYCERPYCIVKLPGLVKDGYIPIMDLATHEIHFAAEKTLVVPLVPSQPLVFTDDLGYHHDPFIMGCWREYTSD